MCCGSPNAQNPRRGDEPRNCTKYLQELWWPNCDPKSLESLARGPELEGGGPGPGAPAARSLRSETLGCFAKDHVEWREAPGTHPPSPHTCSAKPSLEHVVAQLRASQAAAGTRYLSRACTTHPGVPSQEEAALPGAEQPALGARFIPTLKSNSNRVLSPSHQPSTPGSFQQPLPFSAT